MFTKISIPSLLVLVAPLVSAFVVTVAPGATSGGNITISWMIIAGDPPTWSFELVNLPNFPAFGLVNNVDPSLGNITVEAPITATPGSGYTVEAVNISNINTVYATSNVFDIGATIPSSTTASVTGTTTNALTSTANSLVPVSSTSGGAGTGGGSAAGTGAGTGTSSGASSTPSGAATSSRLALTNSGGYAVLVLSAVAGAVAIAL